MKYFLDGRFPFLTIIVYCILLQCQLKDNHISSLDREEIAQVRKQFEQAWLENDSSAVLQTLTNDAVLLPHHGDPIRKGLAAIRQFWFPADVPLTPIQTFHSTIEEISGQGDLAYLQGRFTLAFEYEGQTFSNEGNFLNVMRKEDGRWKLARLIWNDPVPEIEIMGGER